MFVRMRMYKEDYNMLWRSIQSAFCATILLLAVSTVGVAASHGPTPASAACGVAHANGTLKLAGIPLPTPDPWLALKGIPLPTPDPWLALKGIPLPTPDPWIAGIPLPTPDPWIAGIPLPTPDPWLRLKGIPLPTPDPWLV
jgi:hypothetical protein